MKTTGLWNPDRWGEILSDRPVNTCRQREIDLGKAFPVLCLPFVHTFIECTPEEGLAAGIPFLFDYIIGSPFSAPVFLFCMGVGIRYTRRGAPEQLMRRGILLFLMGFLLNVCRYMIPPLAGYWLTGDAHQYLLRMPYKVLGNDILQGAGLCMLCIGLFLKRKIPERAMLAVALLTSLAGWAFNDTDFGSMWVNIAMGHLIGTSDAAELVMSDFPLLNWLFIPVAGYVFSGYLIRVKDKDAFYRRVAPVPLILSVAFLIIEYHAGWGMANEGENAYYHATTYDIVAFTLFALGIMGVYQWIQRFLPPRIMGFLTNVSRCITSIYCIHWVLVMWITNVFLYIRNGTTLLPVGQTAVLSFIILLLTLLLADLWQRIRKRRGYP